MRRTLFLIAALIAVSASPPAAVSRAEGDAKVEARLLYFDGKFADAEALLKAAGPEVANDIDLRRQLAETALKHLRPKTGEERRQGLEAVKRCFGMVATAKPDDGNAVGGAVLAAKELAELDLVRRKSDDAKAQATWALQLCEKAAAAGMSPETKAATGEVYGLRASVTRKVEQADQICADYERGAVLLEEAAAGHAKESAWLAAAAELRFKQALWVHDSIPLDKETRDDAALTAAVHLARRACEAKGSSDATYMLHVKSLCAAREWKVAGDLGYPFMQPLVPAYEGHSLMIPKGAGWKRLEKTTEWDVILERNYDSTDSSVQIMLTALAAKSQIGAKTWNDVEEGVATLHEKRRAGYADVSSETTPVMFGEKKKGPKLWHFAVAGTVANSSRRNKMAEWVWPSTTKKDTVWDLRIIDWRHTPSIEDPDIVMFVNSAIPQGHWPAGWTPPPAPDDPKGKKPPGKKK